MAIENTQTEQQFLHLIQTAVSNALTQEIEKRFELVKKTFLEDLEAQKSQILAGIALEVMKMVDFRDSSDRLVITLIKKDFNA